MKTSTSIFKIVTLLLGTLALSVLVNKKVSASSQDSSVAKSEVKIDNFSFTPTTLTVPAGTKVTWTNGDDVPHTITSSEHKFSSKALDTDEQFSYNFTDPGTYEYFCSLHPKMTAKVIVQKAEN